MISSNPSQRAYIEENMPDVKRPEPVRAVNKVAKTSLQKPVVNKPAVKKAPKRERSLMRNLEQAKKEADAYNAERRKYRNPKSRDDLDR